MASGITFLIGIKIIIHIYDFLTGWIYSILSQPHSTLKSYIRTRAIPTKDVKEGDTQVTFKPVDGEGNVIAQEFEGASLGTMAEAWSWAVNRYSTNKLLGTRDILGEEDEIQSNGRIFSKLELGDYRYILFFVAHI